MANQFTPSNPNADYLTLKSTPKGAPGLGDTVQFNTITNPKTGIVSNLYAEQFQLNVTNPVTDKPNSVLVFYANKDWKVLKKAIKVQPPKKLIVKINVG